MKSELTPGSFEVSPTRRFCMLAHPPARAPPDADGESIDADTAEEGGDRALAGAAFDFRGGGC
jgi:hypothetical protein